eukprot:CAMPEP_0113470848 /NCGR_PEP_ID=MMETSP0014_2-20120614/16666_1 /TAXON_ID=2857 /ORGANISM="Nitzschia sp." /LENGTH=41 /DNA_ID=CAMNT_0000363449 /DNA_START=162 /DNA_END=287 /DNA_ORIENTATION=- /assembly_acc=CAM_ASM_000159
MSFENNLEAVDVDDVEIPGFNVAGSRNPPATSSSVRADVVK